MDDDSIRKFRASNQLIWEAYCHLHPLMITAITNGHLASVRYLLELGYADARFCIQKQHDAEDDEMVVAYVHQRQDIARELHKHGFALDKTAVWLSDPAEFDAWLGPLPVNHSVPCITYRHLNAVDPNLNRWWNDTTHVIVSWPPTRRVPLQVPLAYPHHQAWIANYIHAIGDARRVEARHWLVKNWEKLRQWVRRRAVAIYWQGRTQERLAAPGGRGRREDLVGFVLDFWTQP